MNYFAILSDLGLEEREARIYLALAELGESTVLPIAKKAGIKRTYSYDILDALTKKGLVSFIERNNRRRYSAADPANLKIILERRLENINEILPDLKALWNSAPSKPKVQYFEGKEGLLKIYEQLPRVKRFDAIASPEHLYQTLGDFITDIGKRIVKNNVKVREILTFSHHPVGYAKEYREPVQQIRYLNKKIKLATDLLIFENKLVLISYQSGIHAVVIENRGIVDTHQTLFDLLWDSVEN